MIERISSALRKKPLKVYEIMNRANVVNERRCRSAAAATCICV